MILQQFCEPSFTILVAFQEIFQYQTTIILQLQQITITSLRQVRLNIPYMVSWQRNCVVGILC